MNLPPALHRRDVLLAMATCVLAGVEAAFYTANELGAVDEATVILTIAAAAPVLLVRTAPASAAVMIGTIHLLALPVGHMVSGGFWMLVTFGAVLWAIVQRSDGLDRTAAAGIFLVVSTLVSGWVLNRENLGATAVLLLVMTVAATMRRVTRGREHASATLVEQHEQKLALARDEAAKRERLSLARELHDVVSHAVAVVAVQASAATVSWQQHPGTALAALDAVDASVDTALGELSRVASTTTPADDTDLGSLVAAARSAGVRVRHDGPSVMTGPAGPVAHRVLQEALTNALRHAPGAAVTVRIVTSSDAVEVEVEDDGPGQSEAAKPGFGLVGLVERVGLTGGTLSAGPGPSGGHRVFARLPTPTEAHS